MSYAIKQESKLGVSEEIDYVFDYVRVKFHEIP